jgi:hypothetical protein
MSNFPGLQQPTTANDVGTTDQETFLVQSRENARKAAEKWAKTRQTRGPRRLKRLPPQTVSASASHSNLRCHTGTLLSEATIRHTYPQNRRDSKVLQARNIAAAAAKRFEKGAKVVPSLSRSSPSPLSVRRRIDKGSPSPSESEKRTLSTQ